MEDDKVVRVYWNDDYQTYEALCEDGRLVPLRDSYDAGKLAEVWGLEVEG